MFIDHWSKESSAITPEAREAADRQLLDRLYRNTPSSLISTLFVSVILLVLLWNEVEQNKLFLWSTLLLFASSLKLIIYLSYCRQANLETDNVNWLKRYQLHDFFTAVAWGTGGILLYSSSSIPHQTFLILALGGVAAGAIPLRSPNLPALFTFLLLTLSPLTVRLLLDGDSMHLAMGTMLILYLALSLKVTMQFHHTIKRALELRYENEHLIKHLTQSKDQTERANKELKAVIARHKYTAKELVQAKDNAELAARSKSEFLATMSHEIRTPMNGVIGMAELLLNSGVTGKQLRFTETILHSGQTLLTLINEILDFSRLESGKVELQNEVFDLQELVENIGDQFAARAQHKGIDIICQYPIEAHKYFVGDQDKLNQILNNLVGNAIKFTERGEVTIKVQVIAMEALKYRVRLEVCDTGIGIKAEVHKKIFESFSQADSSTTRNYGGTGLGLAICRKLSELMQAHIGVVSHPGRGSCFWLELELEPAEQLSAQLPTVELRDLRGTRILVVESSQATREILEHQLSGWNALCHCVETPRAALQNLREATADNTPYSVVVIDKKMPQMDGIQLAHQIKASEKISKPFLILLSPVSSLADTGGWMMAGIDGYLSKPVRQDELYATLSRLLGLNTAIGADKNALIKQKTEQAHFSGNILIAEDNEVNSELVSHLLTMLGCRYRIVGNGQEALDALFNSPLDALQDPYDLVLMDCQMPLLDGYQATGKIREIEMEDAANAHIPVIALTANSMAGDREKCLAAGMDDYLSKPFKIEQLTAILQKWLPLIREKNQSELGNATSQQANKKKTSSTHLDQAALQKVRAMQREGAPDIVHKLIKLYLTNSPALVDSMETAIESGDAEQLRNAAHSLKSSSLCIGAMQLGDLCKDLERRSIKGPLNDMIDKLQVIQYEYEEVCKALSLELDSEAA